MTLDHQEDILKFLLQERTAKKYIPLMDETCFEQPYDKMAFQLLTEYVKEFGQQPTKASMLEWFDRNAKGQNVKPEVYTKMSNRVKLLYEPLSRDLGLIRLSIKEFSMRLQTKHLFQDNAPKVKEGDEKFFRQLYRKMAKIQRIADEEDDDEKNRGGMLLRDHKDQKFKVVQGAPTDLKALNKMTSARGFYSPQLIVLMGAPKAFKTGTLLNIALGYVRDGLKVYYADTENGIRSIRNRSLQAMLHCTREQLKDLKDTSEEVIQAYAKMGGDMEIDFFPARSKTLDDVDEEITYLWEEFGWKPDMIVYDYLDLFEPADKSVKEPRLKIQNVYHHAVRLHNKWDCFGMTVSPVGRNAVNKTVINMKDFAEDFAKAYNCHAAFALCRTDDEVKAGVARLVPVAQREGVQFVGESTTCFIRLEEDKMLIEELTAKEYRKTMDGISGPKKEGLRNSRKSIADE